MSELATYIGIEPRTVNNISGATIVRGRRVVLGSDGNVTLAAIGVRGDYVTLQDIENNGCGLAVAVQAGNKIPAQSTEATNIGDTAYSAANGQFSKTSASAVIIGKWAAPASGANALGEVEMLNPL
jgi:hypothetical protein